MKTILKLEELAIALACLLALYHWQAAYWWYLLFLLGPDISFAAYLFGNKAGAIGYNFFHHKGIAAVVLVVAFVADNRELMNTGIVLLGHSSMDRFFGYGLKHFDGFNYTHLGQIGKR